MSMFFLSCGCRVEGPASASAGQGKAQPVAEPPATGTALVVVGAARTEKYLPLLRGKRVGMVVNHTSLINGTHVIDSLLSMGVKVTRIFAPEHGLRGTAADGETIKSGVDEQSGLPVVSLYGAAKEPVAADLAGLDWLIFDIQDVGVRFYTYISTLHYIMNAAAKNNVPVMVFDRPNPNGHYTDGPILDPAFTSFVGMHPIPVVHGMTVGEYAQMINGQGWLDDKRRAELTVIPVANYTHETAYDLPVKPSPNLPNMRAIYLYPSLCFFEGTVVSVGRGTNTQFQVYGAPGYPEDRATYSFKPEPMSSSVSPPQQGKVCHGYSLVDLEPEAIREEARINLSYLLDFYRTYPDKDQFFLKTNYIDRLAGSDKLRQQVKSGATEAEIRQSWAAGLEAYRKMREQYLLYP